ncbi:MULTISPECIES: iron ABC transporter permease [Ensifer]|jgi:iron complex transport system permease protein|uniref:Iron chelate uptake ABC transporter family permease subunit n=1 Tax=Ensifer canadensis TaxID=555315 RepID=A0AAW4FKG9_9HYPH|nr:MULTISPECIES: iron ABC transporter permease [Ensifer]KQU91890.1 iron ABC transporter [Ensifer sp. Root31]KQW60174.1 iron ABC transporter [Ensifer sp. Root1252]KQY73428.1 iron ABC transporter [Ensifer sp. Root142]KRC75939.1 iron ABC transporter [Ensifer sp. Root231]KRC97258.1 iron ABC transporter [Ensifer sp. Root258]
MPRSEALDLGRRVTALAADIRAEWRSGNRARLARVVIVLLVIFAAATFIGSIMTGAADASLSNVVRWLLGASDADQVLSVRDRIIILDIRLPRAVLGMLVGASLAVSGVVMQGLFRNPLADPGLVGVSSGASLGAVLLIVLGSAVFGPLFALFGFYALPVAAFIGGLVTTLLLYRIATRGGQTSIATLLLAGIALGALTGAFTGVLIFIADDKQLRDVTFWGLGSLAGASWTKIAAAAPIILLSLAVTPFLARGLNAITLGEAAAFHMGIPVQRMKNIAIVSVAAATGASVAVSGGIGFVGIVVPHLLRLVIGPDHRYLVPASALLGGTLLILADMIARTIASPAELPIGIVTAFIGAPFFLWILLRGRTTMGL